MTPLPGPPRGNAPPGGRPGTPAYRAGHVLAALLLTLVTLVAGAPAAAAVALPADAPSGAAPVVGSASGTHAPAQQADRADRAQLTDRAQLNDRDGRAGTPPDSSRLHAAATSDEHDLRPTAAVPPPAPRAGSDRPHTPPHFPPPAHGALSPGRAGLCVPRTVPQRATGATVFVPDRVRAALPGVRGPPRGPAGQPAVHRSCSTDLSVRPS